MWKNTLRIAGYPFVAIARVWWVNSRSCAQAKEIVSDGCSGMAGCLVAGLVNEFVNIPFAARCVVFIGTVFVLPVVLSHVMKHFWWPQIFEAISGWGDPDDRLRRRVAELIFAMAIVSVAVFSGFATLYGDIASALDHFGELFGKSTIGF